MHESKHRCRAFHNKSQSCTHPTLSPDPILSESDDKQPSFAKRILLVVHLPEIRIRLADTHLVQLGQVELESVFELCWERPFRRNLGATGIEHVEDPRLNLPVVFGVSCSQGSISFCRSKRWFGSSVLRTELQGL